MLKQLDGLCYDLTQNFKKNSQLSLVYGKGFTNHKTIKEYGRDTFKQMMGAAKLTELCGGYSSKDTHKILNFYLREMLKFQETIDK